MQGVGVAVFGRGAFRVDGEVGGGLGQLQFCGSAEPHRVFEGGVDGCVRREGRLLVEKTNGGREPATFCGNRAGVGLEQSCDYLQQSGFSAAASSGNRHPGTRLQLPVNS